MTFGYAPPPFGAWWAGVRTMLDQAVKRGDNEWDEVEAALNDQRAQLWLAITDQPVAAMVTRRDGDTLEVWLAGGAVLSGAVPFLETAIAAAREDGATNGRIWGRRGWERVLLPYGWRPNGVFLTKRWDQPHV